LLKLIACRSKTEPEFSCPLPVVNEERGGAGSDSARGNHGYESGQGGCPGNGVQ